MRSYPVTMRRKSYRGADPRKTTKMQNYNCIASRVEDYINADMARQPNDVFRVYRSVNVAEEIGEDSKIVRKIIFATDCGHNGITILKGDFERAMAAHSRPPADANDSRTLEG